jgi:hypothetical protein
MTGVEAFKTTFRFLAETDQLEIDLQRCRMSG